MEKRVQLAAVPAAVTGFSLLNADSDQVIPGISLAPGALIDLGTVGHSLSIRANLGVGTAGSVRFNLDGDPTFQIDGAAPYDIAGDKRNGQDATSWLPTVGTHTLVATAYSGKNGRGQIGQSYITLVNVIDSSPPAAPIRVHAGGGKYTDSSGAVFSADASFAGGYPQYDGGAVAGTLDAALYQTRRQGHDFTYSKKLPNDSYAVTLFSEPGNASGTKANIFDVSTDSATLLSHYGIAADVGGHVAVQKTFIVPVTTGRLNLYFDADQGQAMVSAIAVVPQRIPLSEAPLYVNAGGAQLTDVLGRTFEPGTGFTGGTTSQAPFAVDATTNAPLFFNTRFGPQFSFSQPVANGDYELFLNFAEPAGTVAGQRVFNVSANGTSLLDHFDIVAVGGAGSAVTTAFDVPVNNGRVDLAFTGVVGNAVISSIVLIPKDVSAAALPYSKFAEPDAINEAADQQQLLQIALDVILYSNGQTRNGQAAPPDLATLVSYSGLNPSTLVSARSGTATPQGGTVIRRETWLRENAARLHLHGRRDVGSAARCQHADCLLQPRPGGRRHQYRFCRWACGRVLASCRVAVAGRADQ